MRICLMSAVILFFLSHSALALAEIYTFVDEYGVRHYTNISGDSRAKPVVFAPQRQTMISTTNNNKKYYKGRSNISRKVQDIEEYIRSAAYKYQIDPLLIKAVIKIESSFNQFAVSHRGAQGFMQLMPGTARELQVTDPFDAYQNISAGTRYLRTQLNTFNGDLQLSLAAYNAGPGLVSRLGRIPRIPETINYIRKVMEQYHAYRQDKNLTTFGITTSTSVPNRTLITSINVQELVTIN